MSFLLDTNVVSEWVRPRPDAGVVAWLADVDEDRVHLSVASLAEIRHGIERLPEGRRRDRLARWLGEDLPTRFEGRILDVDREVADAWGGMLARGQRTSRPLSVIDACFAATAEQHGLTLVTRNLSDFAKLGIDLLDPWNSAQEAAQPASAAAVAR